MLIKSTSTICRMCLAYLSLSVVTYPRKIVADKLFICSYLIFIWYYNFKHRQIGKICVVVVVVVVSLGVCSLCKATTGTRELSRWRQHFANASFKSTHRNGSFGKSAFFYWPNFLFLFGWKGKNNEGKQKFSKDLSWTQPSLMLWETPVLCLLWQD